MPQKIDGEKIKKALLVYTETEFWTESYRINLGFKAP